MCQVARCVTLQGAIEGIAKECQSRGGKEGAATRVRPVLQARVRPVTDLLVAPSGLCAELDVHDPRSAFQHPAGEEAAMSRLRSYVWGCTHPGTGEDQEEAPAPGPLSTYKATRAQVRTIVGPGAVTLTLSFAMNI